MAFFGRGTLLSNPLASAKKSVMVEKKWGHPVYILGHNKNTGSSHTDMLSYIYSLISIISFGTFLGSFSTAKPPLLGLEDLKTVEAVGTAIKARVTSLQTEMTTIGSNVKTIKDIRELKEKKFSFRFW